MLSHLARIRAMLPPMQREMTLIADRIRGLAAERRITQEQIAVVLGISRKAVSERFMAKVPWAGWEISRLADEFGIEPGEFFRVAA